MAARKRVPMDNTRLARRAAQAKGHTLSRFFMDGDGRLTASCKSCGKTVSVRAEVTRPGMKRFHGGALRLCASKAQPAPLPVFVTNQVQPVQPRPFVSAPVQPLRARIARALVFGVRAIFAPARIAA